VIDLNETVRMPLECLPVTLADLGDGMCRWPIGDPRSAEFAYCGAPAAKSYCAGHRAIAYISAADDDRDRRARRLRLVRAVA
jgi:hypothetical protein